MVWTRLQLRMAALALAAAGFAPGQTLERVSLRRIRAVAGESRLVSPAGSRIVSMDAARTTPALDFPIQLSVDESGTIRALIPPATPAGEYTVDAVARRLDQSTASVSLPVTVEAVTVPAPSVAGGVPVVLLNGYQFICSSTESTVAASADTFGQLASLLQSDGLPVLFFNNCTYGSISIERLAEQLNLYLTGLLYTDGTPVTQVDLVAHSMGGLVARAYLSGMQASGSFSPPAITRVRKFIELATPNFGSFKSIPDYTQTLEMIPGSAFLWSLASWNQQHDDLRGTDTLAVIGNGGSHYPPGGLDDGVVSLTSGSLGFYRPDDQYTRIVPYCHTTPGPFTSLVMDCAGHPGIAGIDSASHLTARIVRSFLEGTPDWTSIGSTPSQDPTLSVYGGMFAALKNATGQLVNDLTKVSFGSVELTNGGAAGSVFVQDFVNGAGPLQFQSQALGLTNCGAATEPAGHYSLFPCKLSAAISSVNPSFAGTLARTVKSGGNITIAGRGFGQTCAACTVIAGGNNLAVSSWTDQAITAILPASYNGFVVITVQTAGGADSTGIMAAPFLNRNAASYAAGTLAPDLIAFGEAADIAAALAIAPDGPWPPSLGGAHLDITDSLGQTRPAPIYYVTTTAISYLVPAGTALGPATVKLTTSAGAIITATVNIDRAAPGLFTANASGSGVPAGLWIRASASGARSQGYLFDPAQPVGNRVPVPVDLGAAGDQVFLSLYGTGFRGATQATARIGGADVPVYGFAAVGIYQGEDVVNLGPLPRSSLAGRGEIDVVVTFDGRPANTVTVNLR